MSESCSSCGSPLGASSHCAEISSAPSRTSASVCRGSVQRSSSSSAYGNPCARIDGTKTSVKKNSTRDERKAFLVLLGSNVRLTAKALQKLTNSLLSLQFLLPLVFFSSFHPLTLCSLFLLFPSLFDPFVLPHPPPPPLSVSCHTLPTPPTRSSTQMVNSNCQEVSLVILFLFMLICVTLHFC